MKNSQPKWIVPVVGLAIGGAILSLPAFLQKGPKADAATSASQNSPAMPEATAAATADASLDSILAETNSAKRKVLLEKWAATVDVNAMAETLAALDAQSEPKLKTEAQGALLTSWSQRDLRGAVKWYGARGGADMLHEQARDLLAQAMARQQPAAMADWMGKALSDAMQQELYSPFFREWTKNDPASAAALLGKMAYPPAGTPAAANPNSKWPDQLSQVAAQWAATDLDTALGWVQSLPEGAPKAKALAQMSYKWAEVNPQAASAYAAQQNNPDLIKNVAGTWAQSDPRAVAEWVKGLPAGAAQDNALTALSSTWAQKDPTAAAAYAASLPAGNTQNEATVAVVSAWAATEPAKTAQWVSHFPEGAARTSAMQELISLWANNDMKQTAQWLQGLPQTPSRDVAVNTFSGAISSTAPATAFQWAQTISDGTMRNEQLQIVAVAWLQQDPSAAHTAITQSNLPQSVKRSLLSNASSTQ